MAPHSFRKPSGQRYYYYRCVKRWQERACEHGKTHGAEELEARMWELVREMLKHPEQLHADLDAMIEQERKAGRRGNPEREAEAWLEKLAEVDRKRSAYQDQQVEGPDYVGRAPHHARRAGRDPQNGAKGAGNGTKP